MHIDTHTYETMFDSVCELLNISADELIDELKIISTFHIDKQTELIDLFLKRNPPKEPIDKILFFHLGRRLNNSENDMRGMNLHDLLLTKNVFSDFLKKFNITFLDKNNEIHIFYCGNPVIWSEPEEWPENYIVGRLGKEVNEDVCFNGLAFGDMIMRNDYTEDLQHGPEFIQMLSKALNMSEIQWQYKQDSIYFCYEYLVPIDNLIINKVGTNATRHEKEIFLLEQTVNRLVGYWSDSYVDECANTYLRLAERDEMLEEYFVEKTKIDESMIKRTDNLWQS